MRRGLASRPARAVFVFAMMAFGISILSMSIAESGNAAQKDYISYWAAGQLLVRNANPYDNDAVFQLEKSAGFTEPHPLVMRNPPHALVLALPLGLVSPNAGVVIWSIGIVAALMIAARLLWRINGRQGDRTYLLIYVFAPALACVQLGQTSTFALLGLAMFLHLQEKRPLQAGLALPLLLIKPHLVLPFCLVLGIWSVRQKAWKIVVGAAAGVLISFGIAACFRGQLLTDYVPVLGAANQDVGLIPTISSALRIIVFRGAGWAQWMPVLLACFWGLTYYCSRRRSWSWNEHGSLLLLVSIWTAPYSWFTDEILLAPAILRGIYAAGDRIGCLRLFVILDTSALSLVVAGVSVTSEAFLWTTTAWLLWCRLATGRQPEIEEAVRKPVLTTPSSRPCQS